MPRHRRSRRSRLHPPVALSAGMLAIVVSFGLATLAPASSAGDPDPVAARIAQPPIETQRQIGAVAGIAAGSSVDEPQVRHVFRALPADPATLTGYQWPLFNGRITLPFGPWRDGSRVVDGQAFHDGLDLATFCGDRIVAAHDGTVLAAGRHYDSQMGWVGDLGPYLARLDAKALWSTLPIVLVIDDGNGYRSIYAHFSKLVVKRGQTVRAGQLVGYEGRTGRASGCHLHYGLFSPLQTGQFGIDPVVAEHMQLPTAEIARIDPLLVLPSRAPSTAAPVTVPHALGAND